MSQNLLDIIQSILILVLAFYYCTRFIYYESPLSATYQKFGKIGCRHIRGPIGAEDIEIYHDNFILISDDCSRLYDVPTYGIGAVENGHVWLLSPPYTDKNLKELKIKGFPADNYFHPHGISILQDKLYIVNHAFDKGGERIDVIQIGGHTDKDLQLNYQYSFIIDEEYEGRLNSVAPINENEFFITTFLGVRRRFLDGKPFSSFFDKVKSNVFTSLKLPVTYAHYCRRGNKTGQSAFQAECVELGATANSQNNGIAWDGIKNLYVSSSLEGNVRVYTIDKNMLATQPKKSASLKNIINLDCIPDNLRYDPKTDNIFVGCFSNVGDMFNIIHPAIKKYEGRLPNTVEMWSGGVEIPLSANVKGKQKVVKTLWQNDSLRMISAYARIDKTSVYGSWFDDGILVCPVLKKK